MRALIQTVLCAATTVALALSAALAQADTIERQFDVGSGGSLVIDTHPGKLDIRTGGRDVQVEVLRDGERSDEFNVTFEQDGNKVTIRGEWPDALSSNATSIAASSSSAPRPRSGP